ncbi:M48 family metallopeptidase [Pararhizobium mangrovi]|uniref:M48 family metallopeptidase n=1 Tax=Pararhizobium mangrovi TaxID=2590452 RepID=A0A506U4V5_9HYPH|nr:M48 family metallopeptidase [Pararhizobium mangrovi]TPW28386.1 M48 family metallopeptidase [Pararhizobium mangrovi]
MRPFARKHQPSEPNSNGKSHPDSVTVSGRTLPLTVREHANARRLTLRIAPNGRALSITAPPGMPSGEVDAFLRRQQGWLTTRLAVYPETPGLFDGGTIALRGVEHRIARTGTVRGRTEAKSGVGGAVLSVGGLPEHLGRRIADFLKREARADLGEHVARHTEASGTRTAAIRIKDTKSRWGSCTSGGVLSFSWRIVMAPPMVIDYLAAHEVAHLREMNHGPRFWRLCEDLCPETPDAKAWLKTNGTRLQAIDFA